VSQGLAATRSRHPSRRCAPAATFSHASEATFAALLDLYGIAWVYEPMTFPLTWHEDGSLASALRPDFFLPELGRFVELTTAAGRRATRKNAKVRTFRALYPEFPIDLVHHRQFEELCRAHRLRLEPRLVA
jgi:hypoxanthine phosphoribosyltransferase